MSFILDALRKSESERQRLGGTGIADLPLGRRRAQPWWMIGIAVLLIANFVLLAVVLLRPDAAPEVVASNATITTPAPAPAANPPHPVQQPQAALPAATASLADDAMPPQIEYDLVDRATMAAASAVPDGPTLVRPLPTYGGAAAPDSLPPLRLDMHVYSPQRANRFVFINMRKYFEGQQLQEGPQVEHITATGVVLSHQGRRWEVDRP